MTSFEAGQVSGVDVRTGPIGGYVQVRVPGYPAPGPMGVARADNAVRVRRPFDPAHAAVRDIQRLLSEWSHTKTP